jgi:hypothetical protein
MSRYYVDRYLEFNVMSGPSTPTRSGTDANQPVADAIPSTHPERRYGPINAAMASDRFAIFWGEKS